MNTSKIIDLTYTIHEGMTTFPVHWHPIVEISIMGRHGIENRETRKVLLGTHTGTHCDAPSHFIQNGKTIDNVPLETLVGNAFLVDFSHAADLQEFGVADFEKQLGNKTPERIIMRFDWSKNWGRLDYYNLNPFISEEAAHWLVKRGVKLLGMDTPMPDNPKHGRGCEVDSPIHKILLGNGVILLEYLCNLNQISKQEFYLVTLPLKIKDGDGAPVRCIAIEN